VGNHGPSPPQYFAYHHSFGLVDRIYFYIIVIIYNVSGSSYQYRRNSQQEKAQIQKVIDPGLSRTYQKDTHKVLRKDNKEQIRPPDKPQEAYQQNAPDP
jgi:hypothetical protein